MKNSSFYGHVTVNFNSQQGNKVEFAKLCITKVVIASFHSLNFNTVFGWVEFRKDRKYKKENGVKN